MTIDAIRIAVAGLGYVGLSNAVLLARQHLVTAFDIDPARVAAVNAGHSPVADPGIEAALPGALAGPGAGAGLTATTDAAAACAGADIVIIATPTDYDPATGRFDTTSVDGVIDLAGRAAPDALIVVKSTVPVGFVARTRARTGRDTVIFSPEFLREGRALDDNLRPSRIVVGERSDRAARFAALMAQACDTPDVPILLTGAGEAEAIKLFANTYLAMRVAFFNELDSYALASGLDTADIVAGVGHDPRIGTHYNNPSFGYGGYCLPKDTRQLLANYGGVPQDLIRAVVAANATRKDFLASVILARNPRVVGIHRLTMKAGSDNFRDSAVLGVMERLLASGVTLIVHEPRLKGPLMIGDVTIPAQPDLAAFKAASDVIVANRMSPALTDVAAKVFTRDLFGAD